MKKTKKARKKTPRAKRTGADRVFRTIDEYRAFVTEKQQARGKGQHYGLALAAAQSVFEKATS